ncbi:MAG: Uma2 family endonuclease [Kiritimatiellia bacterium]
MSPNAALEKHARVAWNDYLTWPANERWEIIDGTPHAMSPSPELPHQQVVGNLYAELKRQLKGGKCMPILSPMDVKLSEHDVVQPDLMVICDPKQLKSRIEGAPTLVVEVLSESSIAHDRVTKMRLYERFKVKEYWIITPLPGVIEVYQLKKGKLTSWNNFSVGDELTSPAFPKLAIDLADVFDLRPSSDQRQLRVIKEAPARYGRKS